MQRARIVRKAGTVTLAPMRKPRRFDDALMTPPSMDGAFDAARTSELRSWCEGGAFPVMTEPLRMARIAPQAGLDDAACALDGSHELARVGRWRGLLWRLRILWDECVTVRPARAQDPWDCGWWREGPLGPASAFLPRRATLLMVRESCDPAAVAALLSTLKARATFYEKPVRVLVVSPP